MCIRDRIGYGIVPPVLEEMSLDQPEIIRHGGRFGVRLKASAPSVHMIRVDVKSEVAPVVGSERQSEDLVNYLVSEFEENPEKLWESQIFGKSLHELVKDGITDVYKRQIILYRPGVKGCIGAVRPFFRGKNRVLV